jgi:UDP-glucose:(heptosyl)LPS alpha-1,3-glucosyltransferase
MSGRPLRIALNHTRLAESGGVEAYVFRLVRSLLERGHQVDFFCARADAEVSHPGFRVVRVSQPRSPRALRVAAFARGSRRAIQRAGREQPYDVVQGFGRTCHHTLYRDGSGCFDDYRAAYLDAVKRRGLRSVARVSPTDAVVRAIERARYAEHPPRVVLAISRLVRDQILRRYALPEERVRVLYSGVDLERHHPRLREAGRAELLRAALPGADAADARVLAFVGSDYGRKGLELLIEALGLLERDLPAIRRPYAVAVLGRDRREAAWRRLAARHGVAGRVRFLGFRRDVPELLAGSDGLVLPSWFDAFGNVVAEAMACGAPVIASARCGGSEWIVDGENGYVVARQQPELLAQRLRALIERGDAAALRDGARRRAERYGWEDHVEALLAIQREVAAAAPRVQHPAP